MELKIEEKKYVRQMIAQCFFCCYTGKKDVEKLISNPDMITDEDFDHVALPIVEINMAKKIFNTLKV